MKTINNDLKTLINGEVLNLIRCWKMVLKNGKILCFSTSDEDFSYENQKYNSISSYEINNLKMNLDVSEDDTEIVNFIDSELIKDEDILSGVYDDAEIEIFILDRNNINKGKISLLNGNISSIEYKNNIFIAKVKGLKSKLNKVIGDVYSPLCRCKFCSDKCGLSKNDFSFTGKISLIINNMNFETNSTEIIDKPEGYFEYGIVKFTNGKNIHQKMEVKQFKNGNILLALELPYQLSIGDTFIITAGCNKKFSTCCEKFNNAINFRGEPHLPGIDILLKVM